MLKLPFIRYLKRISGGSGGEISITQNYKVLLFIKLKTINESEIFIVKCKKFYIIGYCYGCKERGCLKSRDSLLLLLVPW